MTRVLVTGIYGFVGSHLAAFLTRGEGLGEGVAEDVGEDVEVFGTKFPENEAPLWPAAFQAPSIHEVSTLDLRDLEETKSLLQRVQPDVIIHLAAQSSIKLSFSNPQLTLHVNAVGTMNLFEAVRAWGGDPRIISVGAAAEYGKVGPDAIPITESQALTPMDPYGLSKVAMYHTAMLYHRIYGLKIVHTRAYNHFGPYQRDAFVIPSFSHQIARIENTPGKDPVLLVGNLESVRDFLDVRDVVAAYWALALHGTPGEAYNISSGKGTKVADLLDQLLAMATVDITVQPDPARMRPSDMPVLYGSNQKIRTAVGWHPTRPLSESLRATLDFWRHVEREKTT